MAMSQDFDVEKGRASATAYDNLSYGNYVDMQKNLLNACDHIERLEADIRHLMECDLLRGGGRGEGGCSDCQRIREECRS